MRWFLRTIANGFGRKLGFIAAAAVVAFLAHVFR